MTIRTVGLGAFALLVQVTWLQVNCTSDNLKPGSGGASGSGIGGSGGIGGQAGAGRCLDDLTGEGGHECTAPTIVVVDAVTGAVICDPTFTVTVGDAGMICYPTGDPTPQPTQDGSASCTFALQSLTDVAVPIDVRVAAPGYQQARASLSSGGCIIRTLATVALNPIGDASVGVGDARSDLGTACTVDDNGGGGDCLIRGLHRYVCPASAPIQGPDCSPTGEDDFDGISTRCCP